MPHIHDKETGLCVVCKRLEIAAIKEGKKYKRQNYDVRKLAMEKTINRNDPNYRTIMDRHYVALDKPENKNLNNTPRTTFMQKVLLDNKIQVPRRQKIETTHRSQSRLREQNNESVVDTRAKNDKSRDTLRRANIADVARNQMSRSSHYLDQNDAIRNPTPPAYDYPEKINSRPVFYDATTLRKPVSFSKKENFKSKPTAKINDIEDDDAEFDELKFTEESDSNFRDRYNYRESNLSQDLDLDDGNSAEAFYDAREDYYLRGNVGDDRNDPNNYEDDDDFIYIPTRTIRDLRIKLKPKTVIIHHHYDPDRFEEDHFDNVKNSKVIYIEDEAFYKPVTTPIITYKS